MKYKELTAHKADVTIPVYGTIADAEVYLKDKADEVIATLRGANEEKTERIIELQKQVDELDGVKKSAEHIIAKLQAENAQLKKETEFMHSNCKWHAGDGCARLLGEKLAIIAENTQIKQKLEDVNELIKTARKTLEDAKATAYTESVDAGMRERRLKRALWLARAKRAKERKNHFDSLDYLGISFVTINFKSARSWMTCKTEEPSKWAIIFEKVEHKCLKKAEEYK